MPLITDFLDHEFSETIHLSTIHAKYGSNHLDKEVLSKSEESKSQAVPTNKTEHSAHLYIFERESALSLGSFLLTDHLLNTEHKKIGKIPFSIQERPPQASY